MDNDTWTIGRMLEWMKGYLAAHDDANPLVSARWLISNATNLSFMQLYTNIDRPLSKAELDMLRADVSRRAQGEPLQYITGKTSFRHVDLAVKPGVLIPRPETEVLVSEVLGRLPFEKYSVDAGPFEGERLLVADICTGSGCIACSLAYENPAIDVVATDISPECIELAALNAASLGLEDRIEFVECDLASGVSEEALGKFDAVVSNPPYIPTRIISGLANEVSGYEPMLALDGGEDGLDVYRRLAEWSIRALKPGGFMAAELHETTLDEACSIAFEVGFADAVVANDLAGKPRVIVAAKPR